jgi:hypothetical protein
MVLRQETGKLSANLDMGIVGQKMKKSVSDEFGGFISGLLPFFMLLIYVLPVGKIIERMVSEKETRARESMKIMGMTDLAYWLSWWSFFSLQVTMVTILGLIILKAQVFPNSDGFLLFLFFWIYGMSLFGFVVFIQAFFNKSKSASIFGSMIYFGTSFLNNVVADTSIGNDAKVMASFFPTVGS